MYYINGTFFDSLAEAKLECEDLGITRGYGVFDFLITYEKKPFHLEDHLKRLQKSAEIIKLPCPYPLHEIEAIIHKMLEKCEDGKEYSIKILLSGGLSTDGITPPVRPSLIVMVKPKSIFPVYLYEKGIKLKTTKITRSFPESKTTVYLPAIVALQESKAQGFEDALYVSPEDNILESTTSNFFAVKGDVIITPPQRGIIEGITRKIILEIAKPLFRVEIRSISLEETPYFDEAFITSSTREIMPVCQINEMEIRTCVGPVTTRLQALFRQYVKEYNQIKPYGILNLIEKKAPVEASLLTP